MAVLALIYYSTLTLGVLKMMNATLTLPGIAGLILTLGMAVDANIIIFARIREELKRGNPYNLLSVKAFLKHSSLLLIQMLRHCLLLWCYFGLEQGLLRVCVDLKYWCIGKYVFFLICY